MSDYEYRVLAQTRCYHGPEHHSVRAGHVSEGWSEWSEWRDWRGYTRASNQPYRTIRGARSVCRHTEMQRAGGQYREERRFRIQRRPVVLDWEDLSDADTDS